MVLTQCHSLDYLPWLVGKVKSVWGFTGTLSDLEVDVEDLQRLVCVLKVAHWATCIWISINSLQHIALKSSVRRGPSNGIFQMVPFVFIVPPLNRLPFQLAGILREGESGRPIRWWKGGNGM